MFYICKVLRNNEDASKLILIMCTFSYPPEVNEKKEPHSSAFPAKQEKQSVFLLAFI